MQHARNQVVSNLLQDRMKLQEQVSALTRVTSLNGPDAPWRLSSRTSSQRRDAKVHRPLTRNMYTAFALNCLMENSLESQFEPIH